MFKKNLFVIFVLIINIYPVFAAIYRVDVGADGSIEKVLTATDLKWKITYRTFGRERVSDNEVPNFDVAAGTGTTGGDLNLPQSVHAWWGGWAGPNFYYVNERCSPNCGSPTQVYYLLDHRSSGQSVVSASIGPDQNTCTDDSCYYDISMISYGDGLRPDQTAWWADPNNNGPNCNLPVTTIEYYEPASNDAFCSGLIEANRCPRCTSDINSCTDAGVNNAYLCNGVYVKIEFYDGATPIASSTIESATATTKWGPAGSVKYYSNADGIYYLTDTAANEPKDINIQETIRICKDECSGSSGCAGGIETICEAGADGCLDGGGATACTAVCQQNGAIYEAKPAACNGGGTACESSYSSCGLYSCVNGGALGDTCAPNCATDDDTKCIAGYHCYSADDLCYTNADGGNCDTGSECTSGRCSGNVCAANFDCGLRIRHNSTDTVTIACAPEGATSTLKVVGKTGTIYDVVVVETDDPFASRARVETDDGTKALRILS